MMSARVSQTVSEWARLCQSESDCARVSQTVPEWSRMWGWARERARLSLREPDWVRESRVDQGENIHINQFKNWGSFVTKSKKTVLFVAKMLFKRRDPKKMTNLRGVLIIPPWFIYCVVLFTCSPYIRASYWIRKKLFQTFSRRLLYSE